MWWSDKKTSFGYGCVNYKGDEPGSCRFSVGQIAGKTITAANLKQLLNDKKTETIRGFKSKSGKRFDACLVLKEDENKKLSVQFDFDHVEPKTVKDVVCPKCGGKIQVAPFGFVCENNRRDDPESCRFMVGKVASVKIKESVLKELLTKKKTEVISGFVSKTGMKFDAPLKLTEDGDIAFDFPEKPKPIETNVLCPKCGRPLKKTQWKYECECGFNVWHTVAKVELSEEILTELFTTGKTKRRSQASPPRREMYSIHALSLKMTRYHLISITQVRKRCRARLKYITMLMHRIMLIHITMLKYRARQMMRRMRQP